MAERDPECHFDASDAMYGAGFCHTHGVVHGDVQDTQWFAFWKGVDAAVQHWANGTAIQCPYTPRMTPNRENGSES